MSTTKSVFDTLLAGTGTLSSNIRQAERVTVNGIKAAKAQEKKMIQMVYEVYLLNFVMFVMQFSVVIKLVHNYEVHHLQVVVVLMLVYHRESLTNAISHCKVKKKCSAIIFIVSKWS